jgi:hypothetical protein
MIIGSLARNRMSDRIHRLLLAVLLLIGQLSLMLHQLDFDHHANGKECTICLAAQGLDHALPIGFVPPTIEVVAESPGALPVSFTVSRTPVRLVARSPPIPALHA